MYESFYGFQDNPFRLTPDPDYLFLSANHQEALGHLLFGVKEGSGVVVITGEIGAGKTTLLRTLVRNLDTQTTVAYIFNPVLSPLELLQTINADLGLPSSSTSKKELTDELNRFLLEQQATGRRTVVIIDEAQDLEPAVLEQLRLLSNLETERAKLLQIILVGQPELAETLARPDLAQLDQRVTLRWHLQPLPATDTGAYIRHRLQVAAKGRSLAVFTPGAIRLIHHFSRGVPRLINVLCHRALLVAYTSEERQINSQIVRQAIKELRRHGQETRQFLWNRFLGQKVALAAGLLLIIGVLSAIATTRGWFSPQRVATATPTSEVTVEKSDQTEQTSDHTSPQGGVDPARVVVAPSDMTPTTAGSGVSPAGTNDIAVEPSPALQSQEERDRQAVASFFLDLRNLTMVDSAVQAVAGLLQAWEVEGLRQSEWQRGTLDLPAIARSRQLEYLSLTGSINLLSLLDLPMVMELVLPGMEGSRFVLLRRLTGERCRVFLEHERDLPLRVLTDNWLGKGHLFWKDFENLRTPLGVGAVGKNVRRLHTLLAKAENAGTESLVANEQETVFNRQTEAAVARFQREKRLTPDGVVGPLTMIVLYKTLATYGHPSLGDDVSDSHLGAETKRDRTAIRTTEEGIGLSHEHHS
ncbi:MAG: AAA family ATPase [Candidatus Binatia bacterium]